MQRFLAAALLCAFLPGVAQAQSSPFDGTGAAIPTLNTASQVIWTPNMWRSAWQSKMDVGASQMLLIGSRRAILQANTTAATATRLTSDGNAPGAANCVNLPVNSAFGFSVQFTAVDTSAPANAVSYQLTLRMLSRGATTASTILSGSGTADSSVSAGTGSSYALALAADTTNGCLSLTATPPNTDAWHAIAIIDTSEAQ